MKKRILKTVVLTLAFLFVSATGLLFAVPATSDAIKDLTAAQYIGFNGDALTFSAENAAAGYKAAASALSADPNFEALVLDSGFSDAQIFDCGGEQPEIRYPEDGWTGIFVDNAQKSESYHRGEVFCTAIQESGYAVLTEGRWIDPDAAREDGALELMVGADSPFSVGRTVFVAPGFSDKDGRRVLLPAVVVGKVRAERLVPHAGKQDVLSAYSDAPLEDYFLLQNPLPTYMPANFSGQPSDSLYSKEGVTFRIATTGGEKISDEVLTKAISDSGAALYINAGYNAAMQNLAEASATRTILPLVAMIYLLEIIFAVYFVSSLVRIWKRKA